MSRTDTPRPNGSTPRARRLRPVPDDDAAELLEALQPVPAEPWHYSLDPAYRGVWKIGANGPVRVLPWCPEVVAYLVRLDDAGRVVEQRFRVRIHPGAEPATVTNDDLSTGRVWHDLLPGATGTGSKRTCQTLHSLVQHLAGQLPKTYMPQRSGWTTLPAPGGWRYVAGVEVDPATGAELVRPAYDRPGVLDAYARPVGATLEAGALALDQTCGHGWGPELGVAAGLRALGDSLRPIGTGLIVGGRPATGKSLTGLAALAVAMHPAASGESWPPAADASFSAAAGGMERRIAEAGDRAILLDDLPLTSESASKEDQDANKILDRVCRSYANRTPLRDRADRTGTRLQPSVMVRGLPLVTAQRLPSLTQASLIRRVVIAEMAPGDNDTTWWAAHGAELLPGLRALGLAVIDALADLGPEKAKAALAAADQAGAYLVYQAYRQAGGADVLEMAGPLDGAGRMVGGLVLLENLTGITTGHLLSELLEPLAASLARQAQLMADRQATDTDLGEAVGAVIRQALYARRAHVRNAATDAPGEVVPAQTAQAQGLRENPGQAGGMLADGVPIYWLPDRGQVIGIRSKDLHTLAASSRDARLHGLGPVALARHLRAEGVTLPGHQTTDTTTRVRIGPRSADMVPRLVLVPAGLVFDLEDDPETPQEPPEGPPLPRLPDPPTPAPPAMSSNRTAADPGQPAEPPQSSQEPPEEPPVPDDPPPAQGPAQRPTAADLGPWHPARPWVAAAVTAGAVTVYTPEGPRPANGPAGPAPGDVAAAVDAAGPAGDITAVLEPLDGWPLKAPERLTPNPIHEALCEALAAAGWHRPEAPGEPPRAGIGGIAVARPGGGVLRMVPVTWPNRWPRVPDLDGDQPPTAETAAKRLADWHARTGWAPEGTPAATGVRLLRTMIEDRPRGRVPVWQAQWHQTPRGSSVRPHARVGWKRPINDDDIAAAGPGGMVHRFDAVRCYLPAYRHARLAAADLSWDPDPTWDDRRAGLYQIIVPEMPPVMEHLPPLWPGTRPGQEIWTTADLLSLLPDLGEVLYGDPLMLMPQILGAFTAPRREFAGVRQFGETIGAHLADIDALGDNASSTDLATKDALKSCYQSTHGKLREKDLRIEGQLVRGQHVIGRLDWGYAFHDAAHGLTWRHAYRIGGVLPLPGGARTKSPARIIGIETDEIAIVGPADMAPPPGLPLGSRPGQYRPTSSLPIDQWRP